MYIVPSRLSSKKLLKNLESFQKLLQNSYITAAGFKSRIYRSSLFYRFFKSIKKVFLEISQNSNENTCDRVTFSIKLQPSGLQLYRRRALAHVFSCEFCKITKSLKLSFEGVHMTLPPHIISVQVKSRSMLHHGSAGASLKQNKRKLKKPNPNRNP